MRGSRNRFNETFDPLIGYLKNSFQGKLLLPHENLCSEIFCYFGDNESIYFSDSNHISSYGRSNLLTLFDIIEFN